MRNVLIGFILTLICVITLAAQPAPKIGDMAPGLNFIKTLQVSDPASVDLNNLKGNVVVLEFWATWCGPCIPALKHFSQLSQEFKGKPVQFIAITDEDEAALARFMKTVPIGGWVGLDNNGATFRVYQANQRPYTVVIDRGGRIAAITNPESITEAVLNDLIADKKVDLPIKTVIPDDLDWDIADTADGIKPLTQIIIKPAYSSFAGIKNRRGHISADGAYLINLISAAYNMPFTRIVNKLPESNKTYRVSAIAPPGQEDTLLPLFQQFLTATFGLDIKRETRESDVYVLTVPKDKPATITPSTSAESFGISARGRINYKKSKISKLVEALEGVLQAPVIDQTGLTGEYDWALVYNDADKNILINDVRQKLGLELTQKKIPIEMLVVGQRGIPK
jgi:uncharacterized protein (TIGR03435 family)